MGIPRRIGNVTPFAELSRGPTTSVFKGLLEGTDEVVILKLLRTEFADVEELSRSFESEASMLASVDHPNVVRILEYGVVDQGAYITTEYIEGSTLRQLIDDNRLPPALGAFVVLQALKGLQAIHESNLVHRDIKPDNIIVGYDGDVKLVDLGLAVTETGDNDTIGGTLGYIAPDLLQGAPPSTSSDLYAAGCTLFETLFGFRAFRGSSDSELMERTLSDDPFVDVLPNKYVTQELVDLCKTLLDRVPGNRPENVGIAINTLENSLTEFRPQPTSKLIARAFTDDQVAPVLSGASSAPATDSPGIAPVSPVEARTMRRWPRVVALSALPIAALVLFLLGQRNANPDVAAAAPAEPALADTSAESIVPVDLPADTSSEIRQVEMVDTSSLALPAPEIVTEPVDTAATGLAEEVADSNLGLPPSDVVPAEPTTSSVIVTASPWANVVVDGQEIGTTPIDTLEMEPGRHSFVFRNPSFPDYTLDVDLNPGFDAVSVSMWETVGLVDLSVSPWAVVSINGVVADTIPPQESPIILTPGLHRLRFDHPEIGSWETTLDVHADSTHRVEVNMFVVAQ